MSSPEVLVRDINILTQKIICTGLSVDQNFSKIAHDSRRNITVSWDVAPQLSIALKNINYIQIYHELDNTRSYSMKLIDGGLIQMLYTFNQGSLLSHRLAFFPSPDFENFQNNPELYEEEELYADILAKNILPVPIRFDYNRDIFLDVDHPKSHVTFGQYKNCRIPVSGPLSPQAFLNFIIRNFYSRAYARCESEINNVILLERCISQREEKIFHFNVV